MLQQERYLSRVAFSLESALKIHQKDLEFKKQYRILKSEKYEKLCLQSLNMAPDIGRTFKVRRVLLLVILNLEFSI